MPQALHATIEALRTLVAFDTTSRNSNLELVDWACALALECGARIRRTPDETGRKANVLLSLGPQVPGGIVLSGHTDVVPADGQAWDTDPFCLTQQGENLVGRGAADMKGFVAACRPHPLCGWANPPACALQPHTRGLHCSAPVLKALRRIPAWPTRASAPSQQPCGLHIICWKPGHCSPIGNPRSSTPCRVTPHSIWA
jgi:hypothetical protein